MHCFSYLHTPLLRFYNYNRTSERLSFSSPREQLDVWTFASRRIRPGQKSCASRCWNCYCRKSLFGLKFKTFLTLQTILLFFLLLYNAFWRPLLHSLDLVESNPSHLVTHWVHRSSCILFQFSHSRQFRIVICSVPSALSYCLDYMEHEGSVSVVFKQLQVSPLNCIKTVQRRRVCGT